MAENKKIVFMKWKIPGRCWHEGGTHWCNYCRNCMKFWDIYCTQQGHDAMEQKRKEQYMAYREAQILEKKHQQELECMFATEAGMENVMITIALPDKADDRLYYLGKWYDAKQIITKDLYGMGNAIMVMEYHSKEKPDGGNLHIHILYIMSSKNRNLRKNKTIKNVAKHMGVEDNFVDYTQGKKIDFTDKVRYLLGDTDNELKKQLKEKDKAFRDSHTIPRSACTFSATLKELFDINDNLDE